VKLREDHDSPPAAAALDRQAMQAEKAQRAAENDGKRQREKKLKAVDERSICQVEKNCRHC
jgi:hypothetical protein